MKTLVALILAVACGVAQAEVQGVATTPDNEAIINFHDTAGPCVGGALYAEHIVKATKVLTPGCWRLSDSNPNVVVVAFFDAEMGTVPRAAIVPPKKI